MLTGLSALTGLSSIAGGSAAPSPATLPAVALWLRGGADWMRAAADGTGSAPSTTDPIGRWVRPGDSLTSPAFRYATQATAGDRPTVTIATGVHTLNAASGDDIDLSSDVSLAGDFVMWVVLTTDRSNFFLWAGGAATNGFFRVAASGRITASPDSGSPQPTTAVDKLVATSTRTLVRMRRVSDNLYVATSGYAEVDLGAMAGTLTVNRLLSAGGFTSTVVASIGEILISTDATTAATPPAAIDGAGGYFDTNAYLGTPAWGVSI